MGRERGLYAFAPQPFQTGPEMLAMDLGSGKIWVHSV
jgi:hypothetical protein